MRFPMLVASATLLLAAVAARAPVTVSAQATPARAAAPSPSPAPARPKLFVQGPQFISASIAVSPRVASEFRPGSSTGPNGFAAWQSGESVLLGRFHVASFTDYRTFGLDHLASDPVTTIGGAGSSFVPSFRVHYGELESGGGVEVAPHLYGGMVLLGIASNTGYPALHGVGYVLMLQPVWTAAVTPYARLTYTANAGGISFLPDGQHTALTYRGFRYHGGVLIRQPGTRLALDLGYAGERLVNRTNAPAALEDGMLTLGFDERF